MERIKLKAEQPKTAVQPFLYYFASSFVNDGVLPAPEAVFCNSFAFAHKAEAAFFMKPHACGVVFKYNRAKAPDSRLFAFFAKAHRVTAIIRTRQKCSIKAIFVAFAVALRQQGCHLKTTNLIFTPSIFDALQFIVCRFGLNRGIKRS